MTDDFVIGREVEEWIGATPDTPVPDRVKLRVYRRYQGRCYLTGRKIGAGEPWEVEHVLAIGLGGMNRESNLRPALVEPHKAKTADDRQRMAKADRTAKKHLGLTGPKSGGFRGWRNMRGEIVWKEGRR